MFIGLNAFSCSLDSDKFNARFIYEISEHSYGIGSAAHTSHNHIGQPAFCFHMLFLSLPADDGLEFLDHLGIGIRAYGRADYVKCVFRCLSPGSDRLVGSVFQGIASGFNRYYRGSQHLHSHHIQCLTFNIFLAHIYRAFHVKKRCAGCCCHAVLACAGLGYDLLFAHALGKQDLSDNVVDLMCAGMI